MRRSITTERRLEFPCSQVNRVLCFGSLRSSPPPKNWRRSVTNFALPPDLISRMVLESGTFSKGFQKVLVRCTSTSFCTELWRHTMPAQDEVAHNHTPHLFPPRLIFFSPLDRVRGVFYCMMTRVGCVMPLVHGMRRWRYPRWDELRKRRSTW